ncbi:uncharacterized protein [Argopecten irradians]|uniref:uncharacterized protein n=1 Tax=Argopecten irradians TaxID=31199 RepID=UPI00371A6D6B
MKSSDTTVHSSHLWSMTLCMVCAVMVYGASLMKGNAMANPNMHNLAVHVSLVWFGLLIFHSLRQKDWGGYVEVSTSCRNTHLRLDFIIWFFFGIVAIVFPASSVTLDSAHAHYTRLKGIGFITLAIMSGRASNFLMEDDKKAVLLSHGLGCLLLLITMGLNQILTSTFTVWQIAFGMATVFITLMIDVLGSDPKQLVKCARQRLSKLVPVKQD